MSVQFSLYTEDEKVTFRSISEVTDSELRQHLMHQVRTWSQSIRELGLRHSLSVRMGKDFSEVAVITFDHNVQEK